MDEREAVKTEQTGEHILTVENQKRITATCIQSVDAFSPAQIVMSYGGGRIIVTGGDLKIIAFSKSNGSFAAVGTISCVKYAQKAVGLKQKLFK